MNSFTSKAFGMHYLRLSTFALNKENNLSYQRKLNTISLISGTPGFFFKFSSNVPRISYVCFFYGRSSSQGFVHYIWLFNALICFDVTFICLVISKFIFLSLKILTCRGPIDKQYL